MTSDASYNEKHFSLAQADSSEGHRDCCGTATRRIWGSISDIAMIATYFVTWTLDTPDHGAAF